MWLSILSAFYRYITNAEKAQNHAQKHAIALTITFDNMEAIFNVPIEANDSFEVKSWAAEGWLLLVAFHFI